ncbi:hypothetical protein Xcab_03357 [Xenorhabdus cabanillasii JM26]|nr:hypothetical protein Xcab_03357 [Xenorhabdus cabanillasii JM26]
MQFLYKYVILFRLMNNCFYEKENHYGKSNRKVNDRAWFYIKGN